MQPSAHPRLTGALSSKPYPQEAAEARALAAQQAADAVEAAALQRLEVFKV